MLGGEGVRSMFNLLLYIATLTWQPVTLNSDGTPCTDLSGYHVLQLKNNKWITIGTSQGAKFQVLRLHKKVKYTFAVSAFDAAGNESKRSKARSVLR